MGWILTNRGVCSSKNNGNAIEKCVFCRRFEFNIPPFSLISSSQVWHLWQQKNNIAVGRRAHTRARETVFLLWTLCIEKNICFAMRVCHFTYIAKKKVQISAIFSLFALISMLICLEGDVLGRVQKEVAPRRGVRCDQLSTRWNA